MNEMFILDYEETETNCRLILVDSSGNRKYLSKNEAKDLMYNNQISQEICIENVNTNFLVNMIFFGPLNLTRKNNIITFLIEIGFSLPLEKIIVCYDGHSSRMIYMLHEKSTLDNSTFEIMRYCHNFDDFFNLNRNIFMKCKDETIRNFASNY